MEEIRMPKNIRQIGQAVPGNEIYIEDYVITFARKQARKQEKPQLAVLLGKERTAQGAPLFISGAVMVEDFPVETTLLLNNENWSQVYEGIKTYFSELEIVGCLFIRSQQGEEINDRLRQLHGENFPGAGKVLFLYDGEEKEESLYISDGTMLKKQEGFYIYYEKNEPMQEYMIGKNGGVSEEPLFDDKAMKRVRETIAAKPAARTHTIENRMLQLMYGASTVLAAAVLVIGITMLDNHDKMQNMENTLSTISDKVNETPTPPVVVETLNGNTEKSSREEMKEELEKEKEEKQENDRKEPEDEKLTEESEREKEEKPKNDSEDKKEKAQETEKKVTFYTVKDGDTLASISMKKYKTLEIIDEIQELNAIDDKDKIYAGQKILLP